MVEAARDSDPITNNKKVNDIMCVKKHQSPQSCGRAAARYNRLLFFLLLLYTSFPPVVCSRTAHVRRHVTRWENVLLPPTPTPRTREYLLPSFLSL